MNHAKILKILLVLFMAVLCFGRAGLAGPVGTAFTYQGRLMDNNQPADGLYDLQFKLYDASSGGIQVSGDLNMPDVEVLDGYFTADVNFGNAFDGNNRWLDIGVRPGDLDDPNAYTSLIPRQAITPTPYALYALNGGGAGGSPWQVNGSDIYYNAGNVGIGTSSPAAKLSVNGSAQFDKSGPEVGRLTLNTVSRNDPGRYGIVFANNLLAPFLGDDTQDQTFGFLTGWSDTRSYNARLQVHGMATGNWGCYIGISHDGTDGLINTDIGNIVLSPALNVGIGTTSPAAKLGVNGDISASSNYKIGGDTVLSASSINTLLGIGAGPNTTGLYNTFLGTRAGYSNALSYRNTFSGYEAGYFNTTGGYNTFSGFKAGYSNTTGSENTFSGSSTGYFNTTGTSNTFSGSMAGALNTIGSNNTFLGNEAGYSNTTGGDNSFSGTLAGHDNTAGYYNAFLGQAAGYSNTTGSANTFLGRLAGYNNTTGSSNVFLGYLAGYNETGSNKLYIANSSSNPPLIYGDFSTSRVGIGTMTPSAKLDVVNSANSIAVRGETAGADANGVFGYNSSSGSSGYLGGGAEGVKGTHGSGNFGYLGGTIIGVYGHSGSGFGVNGYSISGYGVYGYATGTSGKGVVGYGGTATSYDFDATGPGVNYGATSSIRWKRDIKAIDEPLEKVMHLRGVYFNWDTEHGGHHDVGMIAEEVGKVLPEIVVYEENGIDASGMDYSKTTPLLVEAVKALKTEVDQLQKENADLRSRMEAMEKMITDGSSGLQIGVK